MKTLLQQCFLVAMASLIILPLSVFARPVDDAIIAGELDIDIQSVVDSIFGSRFAGAQKKSFPIGVDSIADDEIMAVDDVHRKSTLKINKNIEVLGKSTFKEHVHTEQGIHVEGKLRIDKRAEFEKNVVIEGTLSVTDLVVLSCIDNLCVNNLSVADEVIANITVANLSATNAIITNATIANLSVTNCIANLCVLHLSSTDAVLDCDLIVGCNISMNDSISPDVGNIIKNGIPFMHNFGTNDTFVGDNAGNFIMTGSNNTGFGTSALQNNTLGFQNTAVGSGAMQNNTEGFFNTGIGFNALLSNTIGSNNTGVGYFAVASNIAGVENTGVGFQALVDTTASGNTAVGYNALLFNTTGIGNSAFGRTALQFHSSGDSNTALGRSALFNDTTGNFNTAVGRNAILSKFTGDNNVAVGYLSLSGIISGTNNIAIGTVVGASLSGSDSNNIDIGNPGVAGDNGIIRIGTGSTHVATFIAGIHGVTTGLPAIQVFVDGNGQLGTISSSCRFKHDISDMDDASAKLYDLHPVIFVYNNDATKTRQYGLIAEEVAQVFPEMVVCDPNGEPYTVQYQVLPVLLLNEVQKQRAFIKALADNFGQRLAALEARS